MPKKPLQESVEVKPSPKMEKKSRKTYTAEYKLRIIAEADACKHGELGQLLRRENLYSSQIRRWREELAEGGVEAIDKSKPGPASKKTAEQKLIECHEREIARLQKKLVVAEGCIELQKKALLMVDQLNSGSDA